MKAFYPRVRHIAISKTETSNPLFKVSGLGVYQTVSGRMPEEISYTLLARQSVITLCKENDRLLGLTRNCISQSGKSSSMSSR